MAPKSGNLLSGCGTAGGTVLGVGTGFSRGGTTLDCDTGFCCNVGRGASDTTGSTGLGGDDTTLRGHADLGCSDTTDGTGLGGDDTAVG